MLLLACLVTFHSSFNLQRLSYLLCKSENVILLCLPYMDVIILKWPSFYVKELCKLENIIQILIVVCDMKIAFWPNTRIIMFKKEIMNLFKNNQRFGGRDVEMDDIFFRISLFSFYSCFKTVRKTQPLRGPFTLARIQYKSFKKKVKCFH